jgi:hypothetical protein
VVVERVVDDDWVILQPLLHVRWLRLVVVERVVDDDHLLVVVRHLVAQTRRGFKKKMYYVKKLRRKIT